MVKIERSGKYESMLRDLVIKNHEILFILKERIKWFEINPSDTRLDNHSLRKSMKGKWAFSITPDIRIIYEWVGKKTVRFLVIGSHTNVYKNPHTKEKN